MTSARLQHQQLFDAIALRNSQAPVNVVQNLPVESAAVANVRNQFHAQFDQIAAEHARYVCVNTKGRSGRRPFEFINRRPFELINLQSQFSAIPKRV